MSLEEYVHSAGEALSSIEDLIDDMKFAPHDQARIDRLVKWASLQQDFNDYVYGALVALAPPTDWANARTLNEPEAPVVTEIALTPSNGPE